MSEVLCPLHGPIDNDTQECERCLEEDADEEGFDDAEQVEDDLPDPERYQPPQSRGPQQNIGDMDEPEQSTSTGEFK